MVRHALRLLGFVWLAACSCTSAVAFERAYWAWQRNEPPSEAERAQLAAQGVHTIYWELGELENAAATWNWKVRFALPPSNAELRFIPVVRLEARQRTPFTKDSVASLIAILRPAIAGADELQIDYDAPDRLIGDYAEALKQLRPLVRKLSITALPHWSHTTAVRQLDGCVDELLPMLYDFEPDPRVEGAAPIPLLVPEKIARYIAEWSSCRIPWRAGLPAFARLTVFDSNGTSRGHIREWNWDDVCFNTALAVERATALGVTLLRAKENARVGNAAVRKDQLVATRLPERAALSRALTAAQQSSARGVVFFRFPDSTDPSGWSLPQLSHPEAEPHLRVRVDSATSELELVNDSEADLEPHFSSEGSNDKNDGRGYALQIDAAAAIFRDAHEGDFWRLIGHARADEPERRAVVIPLATRLTFWFSRLRAGQALKTGAIQLAPGAAFTQARFRVLNFASQSEWRNIEP